MSEVRKQFDFYVANQDDLVKKYRGRYVVIVGEEVAADFGTEMEAYKFASSTYEPGTFMIQLVTPGKENYSQTFHSRVAT
jgi:hypothetical protein